MQRQIVVSLADIRYVSIKCPHCRTRVVLDMKEEKDPPPLRVKGFTPKLCPSCDAAYDSSIVRGIDSFWHSYQSLSGMAEHIRFQGDAEEEN